MKSRTTFGDQERWLNVEQWVEAQRKQCPEQLSTQVSTAEAKGRYATRLAGVLWERFEGCEACMRCASLEIGCYRQKGSGGAYSGPSSCWACRDSGTVCSPLRLAESQAKTTAQPPNDGEAFLKPLPTNPSIDQYPLSRFLAKHDSLALSARPIAVTSMLADATNHSLNSSSSTAINLTQEVSSSDVPSIPSAAPEIGFPVSLLFEKLGALSCEPEARDDPLASLDPPVIPRVGEMPVRECDGFTRGMGDPPHISLPSLGDRDEAASLVTVLHNRARFATTGKRGTHSFLDDEEGPPQEFRNPMIQAPDATPLVLAMHQPGRPIQARSLEATDLTKYSKRRRVWIDSDSQLNSSGRRPPPTGIDLVAASRNQVPTAWGGPTIDSGPDLWLVPSRFELLTLRRRSSPHVPSRYAFLFVRDVGSFPEFE